MADVINRPGIGLGCVGLGSLTHGGSRAGVRLVHAACDCGVSFFDTADAYGDGASERVLGRALRGHRREGVTLATKGGYEFFEHAARDISMVWIPAPILGRMAMIRSRGSAGSAGSGGYAAQDFSPAHLRAAVEASLRRLHTDRIDLYQLHGPPSVPNDDTLAVLEELRAAGKILGYGAGLESIDSGEAWIDVPGVSSLQIPFGLLDPEAGRSLLPAAADHGIAVIARGVFAAGLLGEISPDVDQSMDPRQRALRRALRAAAFEHRIDPLAAAVWYARSRPGVTTVLLGMSTLSHLDQNLRHFAAPDPPAPFIAAVDEALAAYADTTERGPR